MNELEAKLSQLPDEAGVYYHFDQLGQIIYVGKAVNLKNRVRSYFSKHTLLKADPKTRQLVKQITDVRWTVTQNPLQALFLESEMIKRYQPKYNVLERNVSSSSWTYVCYRLKEPFPYLWLSKTQPQPPITYLGPYLDSWSLKKALKYLRFSFPYASHRVLPKKACLDYDLGLCSGPETSSFDFKLAQSNLRALLLCLKGQQATLIRSLKKQMQIQAAHFRYERAAQIRNQIKTLQNFKNSLVFDDLKDFRLGYDQALIDLQKLLNLKQIPARIEAYDISHISGQYVTASMVVAQNGLLRADLSRRFAAKIFKNDDFGQILDILKRRFVFEHLKGVEPDLILIDGGKGQVSAVLKALQFLKKDIVVLGLAKKQEQIIFKTTTININKEQLKLLGGHLSTGSTFCIIDLKRHSPLLKLLQRLRDASHRTAWLYRQKLHDVDQLQSELLQLPGIGHKTYEKLLKHFGSLNKIKKVSQKDLKPLLSQKQISVLQAYFKK